MNNYDCEERMASETAKKIFLNSLLANIDSRLEEEGSGEVFF